MMAAMPRTRRTLSGLQLNGLLLTGLALLAPSAATQEPAATQEAPAAAAPARTIVVQNLAPFARREGVAVVVPFGPGESRDAAALSVGGRATAWEPFGTPWPDGSHRQALCLFVAEVDALAEVRLPLERREAAAAPAAVEPPPTTLRISVRSGDVAEAAEPAAAERLEHNALRTVELRRARLPRTGLVVECLVTRWHSQPHAHVDLAVFFSDPTTPSMQRAVDELAVECAGAALFLRHAGSFAMDQRTTERGSRTVLLRRSVLGDGQGLRRSGVLVPPLAGDRGLGDQTLQAAALAPPLAATEWAESDAFGPFGVVPQLPTWLMANGLRVHLARRHRDFVDGDLAGRGDPFAVFDQGLQRYAGQTGDQGDFGVVKLSLVARSGLPSLLFEVERAVVQEACRPVHFFEADGSPVDPAQHPEWVVWSGRTHWHGGVSKDRLGKPHPEPAFETHGWTGKDREHWSSNHLAAFAQLTGAHWARRELANEARLYLAGQTLDPEKTTSHSGAPRGAGRTALAAAWNLVVRDDALLRERMDQRMEQVYWREWHGRKLPNDAVRPMAVNDPDPRQLGGAGPYWNPWQDAIAAVGFAAQHHVTGSARARELAEELALNVVRHGWLVTEHHCQIAMAMRWRDGKPLTEDEALAGDPKLVQWAHGTAFSEWSIGAVEIARATAARRGDSALATKAAAIQQRYRSNRRPPTDGPDRGGLDRFAEWDAVRWQ
jgi:hypothetical protein